VSSGCIRLQNADVIDLYSRVGVGTKVIVLANDQKHAQSDEGDRVVRPSPDGRMSTQIAIRPAAQQLPRGASASRTGLPGLY
jgi:hypothetical protein